MKVFTASVLTETCTFSPIPTLREDFYPAKGGKLMAAVCRLTLDAFRAEVLKWPATVVEGPGWGAVPGGITTASAWLEIRSEIIGALEAALPVDAVLLSLHGAMVAHGEPDTEGDLISAIRERVGPDVPICVELDPHAHLSGRMVEHATMIAAYHEWPHTDMGTRARHVADIAMQTVQDLVRPVAAVFDCQMIDILPTEAPEMRSVVEQMRKLEDSGEILSISVIQGFPYADVADMGTKVIAYSDGSPAAAMRAAEAIGRTLVEMRGRSAPQFITAETAVEHIRSTTARPVVIGDTADAPGGGAAGDSTYLLHALRAAQVGRVAIAYIADPLATSLAFAVGVGARLPMRIGGKAGIWSGPPFDLPVEVVGLHPSASVQDSTSGVATDGRLVGDVAHVRGGGFDILLTRERAIALHAAHFSHFGIEPSSMDVLIVKSVNNFTAGFKETAASILYVSGPGALDGTLSSYDFQEIMRPKWPMDVHPNP